MYKSISEWGGKCHSNIHSQNGRT